MAPLSSRTANLMNGFQMNGRVVDPQKQSVIVELLLMKKTQARLQQKCVLLSFLPSITLAYGGQFCIDGAYY